MRITTVFIFTLLLQACAIFSPKPPTYAYISNGIRFDFADLHQLGSYKALNQILKGKYKDKQYSMNIVTEFHPDNMKSVGLTKFGAQIFAISYDNTDLDFSTIPLDNIPGKIRPEYIFADIQLVYWPIESIRKNMKGNMQVKEFVKDGFKRVFYKDGKVIIEITYSKKDRWNSRINYKHLERGYEYSIENL